MSDSPDQLTRNAEANMAELLAIGAEATLSLAIEKLKKGNLEAAVRLIETSQKALEKAVYLLA